ncbi:MAG: EAL domain-containing protein [Gammaproteobacteria bacterium]|nr:EAL domain-containing protein [Gammaproteobacteria bacterium]
MSRVDDNSEKEGDAKSFFSVIALKIIVAISVSVLLLQLVLVYFIDRELYQLELAKVLEQQTKFTEASGMYMAELIEENAEDNIYLVLGSITANPLIVSARLEFASGATTFDVGEEATSLVHSIDIKDIDDDDNFITVGTLSTFATTEYIDESRNERLKGIVVFMLMVFLAVFVVSVVIVQLLVGIPLKRITKAISTQSVVPEIRWSSRDEMGAVVTRLNYLHATLREQLSGLKQELSDKERREAARMRNLVDASLEGILIFKNNTVVDLNEPMSRMLGLSRESLLNEKVSSLLNLDETLLESHQQEQTAGVSVADVTSADAIDVEGKVLDSGTIEPITEINLIHASGEQIPVEIYKRSLLDHPGADSVAVVRNVSERKTAEQAMWRMAHFDSLTNLPNRRYFNDILDQSIEIAKEQNTTLTVAYVDLDNFKFVNDSRGHSAGDQLLCDVADSIRETLGSEKMCARLGGDEFAILINEQETNRNAADILTSVLSNILVGKLNQTWSNLVSISIGAASLSGSELDRGELLSRADLALYKAKDSGRGKICFFSDTLDVQLKRTRKIVEKLVGALENDHLELYFQPQVTCDRMMLTGFEALLRWNDPELGQVSPPEIVEVAEQEGIVSQLGRWVLNKAIQEATHWPQHVRLAVNLSPTELADDSLPDYIDALLAQTGFSADRLEIEITETALVSDYGQAAALISRLKDMGVMIALDDFGTGYSSLSMLQDFAIDRIKIDRSFVSNLSSDEGKSSIVASIIDLGSRLGLDVIAEGVESEHDISTLLKFGCIECQGYLISRPVPADQLTNIVAEFVIQKTIQTDFGNRRLAG